MVQLKVHLSDHTAPLESLGRVVWSASDIYGDGADVGLTFVDPEEPTRTDTDAERVEEPAIQVGQTIEFNLDGRSYRGCVQEVEEQPASDDRDGAPSPGDSTAGSDAADSPASSAPADDDSDLEELLMAELGAEKIAEHSHDDDE